ncbi:Uncharacterized protein FKW44_018629, partial [Caligus rogercresseyi]
ILVLVAGEVSETPLEKTFVNFPDAWANFQQMEEIHREESLFARHRRQAPPPMNDDDDIYIYPKDSDEDSGPWGEWEAEGSCSRTCGGGVFRETRPCNASPGSGRDACKGPDKRFKSCNLEPAIPVHEISERSNARNLIGFPLKGRCIHGFRTEGSEEMRA